MSMKLASLAAVATVLAFSQAAFAASGTITVYTSQPNDQMAAVVTAFNKDHPEITVDVFRTGTTELMTKLEAEFTAGSTPADVMLIADAVAMTVPTTTRSAFGIEYTAKPTIIRTPTIQLSCR